MEFLDYAAFGFFVVFIATLFIFGEMMVRTKGLFGVIGVVIMAIYFSYHVTAGDSLWIVILYLIGLSLIIFDGKVTTDGTIASLGILLMVLGLAIPAPGLTYGALVAMAFLIAAPSSYLFTKVFPRRNMWDKMTLKDRLTSEHGYNSMNDSYKELVGKTGITKTPFRPTGTVEVEGKLYSATSDNQWIKEDETVKVLSVDGTRIVIVPKN
ncbi:nodulation protein NfeD [Salipaludibacillus agaradhaerens]|uniref:NfeD family protein n=1 Tax=Salipaludibacillus agaradhaerens TaxID=76935 RepID=UPI00215105FE|nr:NfeD family protein [Salipaludibacillus agaradhaerens]MCR6106354.1 nodulation protein NfeD [Salipaludibacillus agaradhaerens]MCR6118387.1 nodulation protein NfeD [Salipaludibacillus agaradhaerens]UJW57493.1 nodulation protein NfeD [Bacillus sp. A116_S68]